MPRGDLGETLQTLGQALDGERHVLGDLSAPHRRDHPVEAVAPAPQRGGVVRLVDRDRHGAREHLRSACR